MVHSSYGLITPSIIPTDNALVMCHHHTRTHCVQPHTYTYAQILGKCRTVSIDKTDGCQVFLNKDCLDCNIFSAKSSEMNICIPKGNDDYVSCMYICMYV